MVIHITNPPHIFRFGVIDSVILKVMKFVVKKDTLWFA